MYGQPDTITPIILAGGQGVRLRPLTGRARPKPFLRFKSRFSLFQHTLMRAAAFQAPVVVSHEDYQQFVFEQSQEIKANISALILEPEHKNTAVAVALAAMRLQNSAGLMLVMPSDHVLPDYAAFQKVIFESVALAQQGPVLFGVVPRDAESAYGYIRFNNSAYKSFGRVSGFVEKPDKKTAQGMIEMGDCLWNTGIFMCRPQVFLDLLTRHAPELYKLAQGAYDFGMEKGIVLQPDKGFFSRIDPISVDKAVMEKCREAYARDLKVRWSDVGTWSGLMRSAFIGKDISTSHQAAANS